MLAQCANERLDGFEPRSHGSGAPFLQVPLGPVRALVVPEELEALLEQVGPDALEVVLENIGQFGPLPVGQVLLVLQEAVLGALEDFLIVSLPRQLFDLGGPDLVDGFSEVLHDMEPIKDMQCVGGLLLDDLHVGPPHVRADELQPRRPLLAEVPEEAQQCLGFPLLTDEQQPAHVRIDLVDQRQVLVPLSILDLIDPDGRNSIEITPFHAIGDDRLHRPEYVVPGGAE